VYIDDVLAAGVKPSDIYVSCDSEVPARIVRGIPKENLFHGLVPEQYRRYLVGAGFSLRGNRRRTHEGCGYKEAQQRLGRAFTCGPKPG